MKFLKWGLLVFAGLYALACMALLGVDADIFKPPRTQFSIDRPHFLFLKDTNGNKISAYYRTAAEGKPTIIWSHGNAGDLRGAAPLADDLNSQGYGVLAYDYPGYGHSPGQPSEQGSYDAALASYHHLTKELGISSSDIVLAGQSLGSGPTCWLASTVEHKSVVLISPFLSIYKIFLSPPLFPGDRFPNIERVPSMTKPLLIIHGTADSLIGIDHAEKLLELSGASDKTLVPLEGVGHDALYSGGSRQGFKPLLEFLER